MYRFWKIGVPAARCASGQVLVSTDRMSQLPTVPQPCIARGWGGLDARLGPGLAPKGAGAFRPPSGQANGSYSLTTTTELS